MQELSTQENTGLWSESKHQMHFVSWFRKKYKGVLIFHIANGGKRGKAEAMRLKCEGVTPGIPDLFIPGWNLWIEMKTPTGKPSVEQIEIMGYLSCVGYKCMVCYGKDDAVSKVLEFRNFDEYKKFYTPAKKTLDA